MGHQSAAGSQSDFLLEAAAGRQHRCEAAFWSLELVKHLRGHSHVCRMVSPSNVSAHTRFIKERLSPRCTWWIVRPTLSRCPALLARCALRPEASHQLHWFYCRKTQNHTCNNGWYYQTGSGRCVCELHIKHLNATNKDSLKLCESHWKLDCTTLQTAVATECVCGCVFWELYCYPLLTGKLQSTQRTVTFSRTSPLSLLPQGMWKSVCSFRAVRRDSMVSGGTCTINPSVAETGTLLREQTFAPLQSHCSFTLPSTMLDLAMKPEEAFRAPLNTTKLAPVTGTTHWWGF